MKTLILTVGLPRSGKSTWAKTTGLPMVNPDSIRLAIHGQPFLPEYEKQVWETARLMVNSLFIAGHDGVILDATSVKLKDRDKWKGDFWTVKFKVFDTSKEVCLERAKKEWQDYLLAVIERMAATYQPLDPMELLNIYQ
jgi:predicted kinase